MWLLHVVASALAADDECARGAATAAALFPALAAPPRYVAFDAASEDFVPSIVNGGRPVVLTGSPAARWGVVDRSSAHAWTPAVFAAALESANQSMRAHTSVARITQLHSAVSPLGALDAGWLRPYDEVTFVPADFMQRASEGEHLIYFTPLKSLPKALREGVGDVVDFAVPWRRILEVNTWIAGAGQATPAHYDVSGNMYVQVHGRKRFVLFPPSAARYLYLFPKIHPADRSTQIDFDASIDSIQETFFDFEPDEWSDDGCDGDAPVLVDLRPGEVLYIPPYWFHYVAPLERGRSSSSSSSAGVAEGGGADISMSISIALDSEQVELRELLRAKAPPIARSAPLRARDAALRAFFVELLGGGSVPRAARFARELVRTRWSHAGADVGRPRVASRLEAVLREESAAFEQDVRGPLASVGDATRSELRGFARALHSDLHSRVYEFSAAELEIELGNYVEDCVAHTLNATLVGAFLRRFARVGG